MRYFLNLILSLQFHQHKPAERCSVNSSSFAYRNTWEIQYCRKHVRVKFHLLEIFQKPIILTRSSQKWYIALHIRLTYKQMVQRHCCFWQNSVLLFMFLLLALSNLWVKHQTHFVVFNTNSLISNASLKPHQLIIVQFEYLNSNNLQSVAILLEQVSKMWKKDIVKKKKCWWSNVVIIKGLSIKTSIAISRAFLCLL